MYTVHIPYKYRQTANPLYGYVNPPMYHTISLLEAFLQSRPMWYPRRPAFSFYFNIINTCFMADLFGSCLFYGIL